jgi:hypothetical protein
MEKGVVAEIVTEGEKQKKRKELPICNRSKEIAIAATVNYRKSPFSHAGGENGSPMDETAKWYPPFGETPKFPWGKRTNPRRSTRPEPLDVLLRGTKGHAHAGSVSFTDKQLDGTESERKLNTLQALVEYNGAPPYAGRGDVKERLKVNNLRRGSQRGGTPCYDILDGHASAIYAYSLPLAPLAGLLQGLKNEISLAQFKKETKVLNSFTATSYMFLHWDGGVESSKGDYKSHNFVKSRPGLAVAIESIGNYFTRRILRNPKLGGKLQPGLLCNNPKKTKGHGYQPPHWDFIGWRKIKAKDMPWVVHIPLCREGMMLHVWPTERDEDTHNQTSERMTMGKPMLVHVAFGDALVLRADVCHGGCFGNVGNMRFHMVLRNEDCCLAADRLHFLDKSGVDPESFKEKGQELCGLVGEGGSFHSYFGNEINRKRQTVAAYIKAMEALYPEADQWCQQLMENVTF